jgi:hypothetical protein
LVPPGTHIDLSTPQGINHALGILASLNLAQAIPISRSGQLLNLIRLLTQ